MSGPETIETLRAQLEEEKNKNSTLKEELQAQRIKIGAIVNKIKKEKEILKAEREKLRAERVEFEKARMPQDILEKEQKKLKEDKDELWARELLLKKGQRSLAMAKKALEKERAELTNFSLSDLE